MYVNFPWAQNPPISKSESLERHFFFLDYPTCSLQHLGQVNTQTFFCQPLNYFYLSKQIKRAQEL